MAPLEGLVGRTGDPRGRETHKRLPACSENEHAGSRTAHDPASASWRLACCTRQVRCVRESIGRFQRSSGRRPRLARRHAADSVPRAAHCSPTTLKWHAQLTPTKKKRTPLGPPSEPPYPTSTLPKQADPGLTQGLIIGFPWGDCLPVCPAEKFIGAPYPQLGGWPADPY